VPQVVQADGWKPEPFDEALEGLAFWAAFWAFFCVGKPPLRGLRRLPPGPAGNST